MGGCRCRRTETDSKYTGLCSAVWRQRLFDVEIKMIIRQQFPTSLYLGTSIPQRLHHTFHPPMYTYVVAAFAKSPYSSRSSTSGYAAPSKLNSHKDAGGRVASGMRVSDKHTEYRGRGNSKTRSE